MRNRDLAFSISIFALVCFEPFAVLPSQAGARIGENLVPYASRLMSEFGWSREQALGALASFAHESHGKAREQRGMRAGTGGYGWAQWTGPRRTAFVGFVLANKLVAASDEANYAFFVHELRTTFPHVARDMKLARTLPEATTFFARAYEGAFSRGAITAMPSRHLWARTLARMDADWGGWNIGRIAAAGPAIERRPSTQPVTPVAPRPPAVTKSDATPSVARTKLEPEPKMAALRPADESKADGRTIRITTKANEQSPGPALESRPSTRLVASVAPLRPAVTKIDASPSLAGAKLRRSEPKMAALSPADERTAHGRTVRITTGAKEQSPGPVASTARPTAVPKAGVPKPPAPAIAPRMSIDAPYDGDALTRPADATVAAVVSQRALAEMMGLAPVPRRSTRQARVSAPNRSGRRRSRHPADAILVAQDAEPIDAGRPNRVSPGESGPTADQRAWSATLRTAGRSPVRHSRNRLKMTCGDETCEEAVEQ